MRTNIEIDDQLMADAQRASGLTSKKATVERGLKALIQWEEHNALLALAGKIEFHPDILQDRRDNGLD